MKKILFLFMLVIISASAIAVSDYDVYQSRHLELKLDISTEMEIERDTGSALNYVTAKLLFYPQDDRQQIIQSLVTNPKSEEDGDILVFTWNDPTEDSIEFGIEADIKTENTVATVRDRVDYPVDEAIPSEYDIYTESTDLIDSDNKAIIDMASSLAEGKDDMYEIVFAVGDWINENIEYSLDTMTESITQKPSWTLRNRYGVCDETTALFIAMVRSLGIPARFVSGMAYTNYNDLNDWGPHAWAEVYFPYTGWVPFDITYGEFGFIDASHIALKKSADAQSTSTQYEWKGRNVEISTNKLDIDVQMMDKSGKYLQPVLFTVDIAKEEVGFGSYNLVEVGIENIAHYYTITELSMARTTRIDTVSKEKQRVLLKPKEEKKLYWMVKLDDDLNKGYTYTFPVMIYTPTNVSRSVTFSATERGPVYSLDDMAAIEEAGVEKKESTSNANLYFVCTSDKGSYYLDETASISCIVKNQGNMILDDLKLCVQNKCKSIDLPLAQTKTQEFSMTFQKAGEKDITASIKNGQVSLVENVEFEVYNRPTIEIKDIEAPEEVKYKDQFRVAFTLHKNDAMPKDVKIEMRNNNLRKTWEISQLELDREFLVNMQGKDLDAGDNRIKIKVDYSDDHGEEYSTEKEIKIVLKDVNLWQRFLIWLRNVNQKLVG